MNKVILVVDDEERVRSVICRLLHFLDNVECLQASNVNEAIQLLNTFKVDLVTSDLNMPGETGLYFLEYVRAHNPSLPFLILSGSLVLEEERKLREAGADAVLSKPPDPREFMNVVRNLMKMDPPEPE